MKAPASGNDVDDEVYEDDFEASDEEEETVAKVHNEGSKKCEKLRVTRLGILPGLRVYLR